MSQTKPQITPPLGLGVCPSKCMAGQVAGTVLHFQRGRLTDMFLGSLVGTFVGRRATKSSGKKHVQSPR